ncbi:helix-turn-helix transcriptional regulator [Streptomyces sp. NPDC091368]|uniref:helix-turn-helix transcriptional regulator n=1 Tax=Streptomyces sp. NPDC091368 TaxID=3365993 RepID=UPI00380BA997
MTNLLRKNHGTPIRAAMERHGLTGEKLAKATKKADAMGRGISLATVSKLAGRGETAVDTCRLRTAWLIATALSEPLQDLFDMPSVSTDTVERSSPHGDSDPR